MADSTPYYEARKDTYAHGDGTASPSIAILCPPISRSHACLHIAFPTREARDAAFETFDAVAEAISRGLPPPPVDTFIELPHLAFDARDVVAVEWRNTARFFGGGGMSDTPSKAVIDLRLSRNGGELLRHVEDYGESSDAKAVAERDAAYTCIVAAMKESRSNG